MKAINLLVSVAAISAITNITYAQKQPQVQQISLWAPKNVKIDGKLDEWPSPNLSAYNSIDRIYYAVSNDDNNLYFTIRGMGNGVAKKAIAGGMVLTIANSEKKSGNDVMVLFPLPQTPATVEETMGVVGQVAGWSDPIANRKQVDSIVIIANRLLNNSVKEMSIKGIKEISDPTVSKYNEYGIKAEIQFVRMQPIIEFAIPLKYLKKILDGNNKISYNIKINAVPQESSTVTQAINDQGGVNPNVGYALNPTDFWGEYVLAQKQ